MQLYSGPHLFAHKADLSLQKTICLMENPWTISIRVYHCRFQHYKTYQCEDLNTGLIRLHSEFILTEAAGFTNKGMGNANKISCLTPAQQVSYSNLLP